MASRTRASIGSIHFLSRGSSSGKMPTRSSDARITVLTARTRRTWSDTRSRFLAPSLSPFLNASTDGNTVCCMEALSGHSTSKPWWWYLNKKQFNHTLQLDEYRVLSNKNLMTNWDLYKLSWDWQMKNGQPGHKTCSCQSFCDLSFQTKVGGITQSDWEKIWLSISDVGAELSYFWKIHMNDGVVIYELSKKGLTSTKNAWSKWSKNHSFYVLLFHSSRYLNNSIRGLNPSYIENKHWYHPNFFFLERMKG